MLFNFSTHNKLLSYSAAVSDFIFAAHSLRNGNDPHITSLTGMFVSLNFLLAWKARWECLFARVDTVSRILISGKGGKPGNFLVSFLSTSSSVLLEVTFFLLLFLTLRNFLIFYINYIKFISLSLSLSLPEIPELIKYNSL